MSPVKILTSFALFLLLISCGRPDAVNTLESMNESSEGIQLPMPNQLDSSQFGTYRGVLPCENCGAKQVILELRVDNRFTLKEVHKDEPGKICTHSGDFKYDDENNRIRLAMEGNDPKFEMGEELLYLLDRDNKRLLTEVSETPYLFKSKANLQLAIWQIVKIGDLLLDSARMNGTALQFLANEQVSYTAGCNQCNGKYKSLAEGEIYFKTGACTKKLCPGEDFEMKLSKALNESKKYKISGRDLILQNNLGKELIVLRSLL